MRLKLFTALCALAVIAGVAVAAADQVVEEIIARVNDSIITRTQFQRESEALRTEMQQQGADQAKIADRMKDVLRDAIDQQLLLDKAKDLGLNADNEVVKRLGDMMKESGVQTMEQLEQMAAQQGVSFEDFKENMKNQLLTQMVIQREVAPHVPISPAEEQEFYNTHQKELERPEEVRLSEILIPVGSPQPPAQPEASSDPKKTPPPAPEPTPEELAAAQKKAEQALAEIKNGAKFPDIAKKYSGGPTAQQGGDLGFFRRGVLSKELEDQTFGQMKKGEVSGVIRTRQGFVILQLTEKHAGGVPPLKEVEPQIMDAIYLKKLQPQLRAYLTKLREEAYIDIRPGYVDTGASPNQTKPIIATGPTPGAKDHPGKKKKKFGVF
jgi:peptidyl-prolyl cis-trans isomerase SurA